MTSPETKAEAFIREYVRHTSSHRGQPFNLLPWQREILRRLFTDLLPDGRRRIRTFYLGLAKKQGKSELLAALALYFLLVDPEPAAEIYSAAADREQAKIILRAATSMVEQDERLSSVVKTYRDCLSYTPRNGSGERIYRALSHESGTKHGLRPNIIIADELHAWQGEVGREFFETLTTGFGARREPLTLIATNAGWDRTSICWEFEELIHKIDKRITQDPSFAYFIARAPEELPWDSLEAFQLANPSFGTTCDEDFYRREVIRAKNSPAFQNTYRRFYLNQWTDSASAYIPVAEWDHCREQFHPDDLLGRDCFGGLDLADTTDLAAFVLFFPPNSDGETGKVLPFFWIPGDNLHDRCLKDQVPYESWARDGFINTTPGNVIDHDAIEAKILQLRDLYNIREIAFDRWGAVRISSHLQDAGIKMVQFPGDFASMSIPTKDLLHQVLSKRIAHDGHPVLRWNIASLIVKIDGGGRVRPDKKKSREKIDGVVALVMALGGAAAHMTERRSVYEDRGILLL